jgi:hypothetical protein
VSFNKLQTQIYASEIMWNYMLWIFRLSKQWSLPPVTELSIAAVVVNCQTIFWQRNFLSKNRKLEWCLQVCVSAVLLFFLLSPFPYFLYLFPLFLSSWWQAFLIQSHRGVLTHNLSQKCQRFITQCVIWRSAGKMAALINWSDALSENFFFSCVKNEAKPKTCRKIP